MCGNNKNNEGWQTDLPDSCGDWLWISQWDCGCIIKSGIAYVYECEEESYLDHYNPSLAWKIKNDKILCIGWEGTFPAFGENGPLIHYWKKLQLPTPIEDNPNDQLKFNKTFLRYIKK